MSIQTGVSAAVQVLAHVPGMARYGSKPSRELPKNPEVQERFLASLRTFDQAVGYAPHQAYLGALHPRDLPARPWVGQSMEAATAEGPDGEIISENAFLKLMADVDEFDLLKLGSAAGEGPGSLSLFTGARDPAGVISTAHPQDEALTATVLLENLACKATATLALRRLLINADIDPLSVDYVISCSEEAVGDRYQRGGGNMAKAIASASGLTNASGADVKNFCAAPIPAIVFAGALVSSGVFGRVAVVAGGSVPKLGMKFQGHLKNNLPIMEDVLGGFAALIEAAGGESPSIRLDVVGRHPVGAGGSNPQILEALAMEPLRRAGLKLLDVDDFATELHNPEITEPQGSGNVAERNYKTIAALGVRLGDLKREDISTFMAERGMPGYAPTQGHLASAICYLPHAVRRLKSGDAQRVHMMAKGSLFLGRMSQMSDGMSVLLERR